MRKKRLPRTPFAAFRHAIRGLSQRDKHRFNRQSSTFQPSVCAIFDAGRQLHNTSQTVNRTMTGSYAQRRFSPFSRREPASPPATAFSRIKTRRHAPRQQRKKRINIHFDEKRWSRPPESKQAPVEPDGGLQRNAVFPPVFSLLNKNYHFCGGKWCVVGKNTYLCHQITKRANQCVS